MTYSVQHLGPVFWVPSTVMGLSKAQARWAIRTFRKNYPRLRWRLRRDDLPMDDQLSMWVGRKKA